MRHAFIVSPPESVLCVPFKYKQGFCGISLPALPITLLTVSGFFCLFFYLLKVQSQMDWMDILYIVLFFLYFKSHVSEKMFCHSNPIKYIEVYGYDMTKCRISYPYDVQLWNCSLFQKYLVCFSTNKMANSTSVKVSYSPKSVLYTVHHTSLVILASLTSRSVWLHLLITNLEK